MSQSNDFFGPFENTESPIIKLPAPCGEIKVGVSGSSFEFGVPGYERISFIRTWEIVGKNQTRLLLTKDDISLKVARFIGMGGAYPDRYEVFLKTKEFSAEIRFQPFDFGKGITGYYSVTRSVTA